MSQKINDVYGAILDMCAHAAKFRFKVQNCENALLLQPKIMRRT